MVKGKSRYISITLHVMVWIVIFLLPLLFKTPSQGETAFLDYPVLYFGSANLVNAVLFYFNAYYLSPKLVKRKKWFLYSLCLLAIITIFSAAKLIILKLWFDNIELDEWAYRFAMFSTIGFLIISTLFSMAIDSVRLEKEQKEILAERLSAELKFYRSQVSPHFLFNVLSTLISLGRKKSDLLEPSLIMLSELIRYMLYEANEKRVSILKEVEYLRCYISLQQLRFGHDDVNIEANFTVPDNEIGLTMEPMLLIPFVENAFKHGIGSVKEPIIKIDLNIDNGILYFNVLNKYGQGLFGSKDDSSGIGLSNIRSRLKLLYGGKHALEIRKGNFVFHSKLKLELK